MKRDERNASRFSSGCGHDEDCHEYNDGTVTRKKVKLYLSWVLRRGDIVRYSRTMQKHTDYHY